MPKRKCKFPETLQADSAFKRTKNGHAAYCPTCNMTIAFKGDATNKHQECIRKSATSATTILQPVNSKIADQVVVQNSVSGNSEGKRMVSSSNNRELQKSVDSEKNSTNVDVQNSFGGNSESKQISSNDNQEFQKPVDSEKSLTNVCSVNGTGIFRPTSMLRVDTKKGFRIRVVGQNLLFQFPSGSQEVQHSQGYSTVASRKRQRKRKLTLPTKSNQSSTVASRKRQRKPKLTYCTKIKNSCTVASRNKNRKHKYILPIEIQKNIRLIKYWHRRYLLFSRFDMGIELDEESWYSVTPEKIAKRDAKCCKCDIIVDAFCGAGGNTIQFAFTCKRVIAIDIDPKKIELARHNAEIYRVADRIEFIVGDFFQLASQLKADHIFFSPPWGGLSYSDRDTFDLEKMLKPAPLSELMKAARQVTNNISLYLPKSSNTEALQEEAGEGNSVEIEEHFLDNNFVAITAHYKKSPK